MGKKYGRAEPFREDVVHPEDDLEDDLEKLELQIGDCRPVS